MKKQYTVADILEIGNATELVLGDKEVLGGDFLPDPERHEEGFTPDYDE